MQIAFRLPPDEKDAEHSPVEHLVAVAGTLADGGFEGVPSAVPTNSVKTPWEPLILAATREWIKESATKQGFRTSAAFAAL